jgi:predicted amidohydrolase
MSLDKAVELTTIKPSRVFDFGVPIGTLKPGSEADIGIFEVQDGRFEFSDGVGVKRAGRQKLVSKLPFAEGSCS